MSSDREGVYSGKKRGMAVLWRRLYKNAAFAYNPDNCHRLETMMEHIMAKDDMKEVIETALTARYGQDGSKATWQWIKEQNPSVDPSLYKKLRWFNRNSLS